MVKLSAVTFDVLPPGHALSRRFALHQRVRGWQPGFESRWRRRACVAALDARGQVVGIAQFERKDSAVALHGIWVDPVARGSGLGRVLWDFILRRNVSRKVEVMPVTRAGSGAVEAARRRWPRRRWRVISAK